MPLPDLVKVLLLTLLGETQTDRWESIQLEFCSEEKEEEKQEEEKQEEDRGKEE